jgi:hypothetical protein
MLHYLNEPFFLCHVILIQGGVIGTNIEKLEKEYRFFPLILCEYVGKDFLRDSLALAQLKSSGKL